MLASLLAAAALASAAPHPTPAKEPTPAELKAENAQLQQKVVYLSGLVTALQSQRDQNANQAADAAARWQATQGPTRR